MASRLGGESNLGGSHESHFGRTLAGENISRGIGNILLVGFPVQIRKRQAGHCCGCGFRLRAGLVSHQPRNQRGAGEMPVPVWLASVGSVEGAASLSVVLEEEG